MGMDDMKGNMSDDMMDRFNDLKMKVENGSATESERDEYNSMRDRMSMDSTT